MDYVNLKFNRLNTINPPLGFIGHINRVMPERNKARSSVKCLMMYEIIDTFCQISEDSHLTAPIAIL